jgi:hypothetical protein
MPVVGLYENAGHANGASIRSFRKEFGTSLLRSTWQLTSTDGHQSTGTVELPASPDGWQLDWRVGAAMAVALDALQAR